VNPADPEDRTVASAEYVLGTLSGAEREAFLAQLARDPALQSEVGYWQDRLLGLAARVAPVEPSREVWDRVEAALQLENPATRHSVHQDANTAAASAAAGAGASTTTTSTTAAPSRTATGSKARQSGATTSTSFWNRLGFWRGFSGLAFAASLLLASLLVLRQPAPTGTQYVAVLQSPDKQQAGWLVQATESGPVRLVALADPGSIPPGRSWEFWTKGKDAAAPTSLGLVRPGSAVEIPRSRLPELGDEQLFEITLEPEAGSPTGRPTGPILYVGKARRA
jgi:anti-sigma-K factor RskA